MISGFFLLVLIFLSLTDVLLLKQMNKTDSQKKVDDLVQQAQAGNRQAFSELVRELMTKITALTYKMTGDRDLAIDLAQDTFVAAWQNLQTFKFEAKFESWLYRIAYNKTLNEIKRNEKQIHNFEFENQPSKSNPERELYQRELKQKVISFMQTLPTEQRAVFECKFYKEMPFHEIAEVTGKALGTVKTLYREAIKKLRVEANKQRWHA